MSRRSLGIRTIPVAAALLLLWSSPVPADVAPASPMFTISGQVVDAAGNPVPEFPLVINGQVDRKSGSIIVLDRKDGSVIVLDHEGRYSVQAPAGTYTIAPLLRFRSGTKYWRVTECSGKATDAGACTLTIGDVNADGVASFAVQWEPHKAPGLDTPEQEFTFGGLLGGVLGGVGGPFAG